MARHSRTVAIGFAVLGVVLTVLYGLQLSSALQGLSMVVIALGACAALLIGPRIHRPAARLPWRLVAAAAMSFLLGLIVRPWATEQDGPSMITADLFTLAGYAMLIVALALMLRSRGSLERHAVIDGVIICLGTALLTVVLLAMPAAEIQSRPVFVSILAGAYPLLDVVLLLLVLNLGFSSASRSTSFRFITLAMIALFIGDVGYAWIGTQGKLSGPALLDLPYLLGYTCFGVAALHPSMVRMSSVVPWPAQPWSLLRLLLIVPALVSPAILAARPHPSGIDRSVVLVASVGLVLCLLVRALSAVRGYSTVQQVLRHQATHDALTGLPNRVLLAEHLQRMLESPRACGGKVWLLFVDLDGFKLINDHWGHETGDRLLVEVARRLVALTAGQHLVARIGGDEFAVLGDSLESPCGVADRIQASLREPIELAGLELVVTGSIGVATDTDQEAATGGAAGSGHAAAEAMLRDADTAMYRAKADGRDRWAVYDAGMRQTVRKRVETELALRCAVARGQLWVAYQPVLDIRSQHVVGAEALVRWTDPDRGPISPVEFIPVAEETGLITEIGTWVLEESLRQVALWRDEGILPAAFSMSVNASARQLKDGRIQTIITDALARHGVAADQVTLEITESVMMSDADAVAAVLAGLRAIGLRLSVDDFGTGYSSLGYLSRFPVTEVKIDRTFVDGLGGADAGDEAIVRAVVAMASALQLSVVAEGVETQSQRDALCELGVHSAQGWLWGAAVGGAEFAARHLAESRPRSAAGNSYAR